VLKQKASAIIIFLSLASFAGATSEYQDSSWEPRPDLLMQQADSATATDIVLSEEGYYSDSAFAVDDEIWRQIRLAKEYFAQGVAANQEAAWDEAQYYLERSLRVLADLDIDTAGNTPEAQGYSSLLNQVVADYRLTLLSLGSLPEDASPSAFLEKFSTMSGFEGVDYVKVKGEEKAVTYNVPITLNDKVKKSIVYFQTVAREAFERYLERSGRFIPLMTEILAQYGVPTDIVYLPLIESGFNCRAYSWARASGPWQFIASTGKLYGLDKNWWYDERRDFVKSTHSAARFLKNLHDQFNSWELALAAYNGGPGRVSKSMAKQRTDNFWDLDLRKQTEDYVPFFMAATIIAKNPELYGFNIHYDDPIEFDVVKINKCLDLKTVAKITGTTVEHIRDLNPELLRDVTPPGMKNYELRIPRGSKEGFLASLPNLNSPKETNWVHHTIRRGETVSTIANRYGVSQYAIMEANNLTRRSNIYAGKTLIVPVPLDGSSELSSSAPVRERKVSSNNTYVVQGGDNLWDIARSFNTTPDVLRKTNYLGNSGRIYVGQVLKLPVTNKKVSIAKEDKSDRSPAKKTSVYVVKEGDSLWDIARRYGLTTAALRRLNGLSRTSHIAVGQKLLVSDEGSDPEGNLVYTVKRGDTLDEIARAFGTTVRALMDLNKLTDASRINIGTKLKIAKPVGDE